MYAFSYTVSYIVFSYKPYIKFVSKTMFDVKLKIASALNRNISGYFVFSTHKDCSYP